MKAVLLLTFSFLFASLTNLPLAFSKYDAEPVFDLSGKPLYFGQQYYIRGKDDGVVGVDKIESGLPVTVFNFGSGLSVKFNGSNPFIIYTALCLHVIYVALDTPLNIEFTLKPKNAENSWWSVFKDDKINNLYVGIRAIGDHPILIGKFRIQKYRSQPYNSYKLVFCPEYRSYLEYRSPPIDIGTHDIEGRRRLVLTEDEPFQILFENVADANIKSV
ncbi:Kunitz-type trypsin inhibitor-like 2 protein, partial [Mucuna pruriens]